MVTINDKSMTMPASGVVMAMAVGLRALPALMSVLVVLIVIMQVIVDFENVIMLKDF